MNLIIKYIIINVVMEMITTQRYELILNFLNENGNGTINDFVKLTGTSTATIRRDLTYLEEQGRLKRIHGGATIDRIEEEETYSDKSVRNLKDKISIAKRAASLIEDGDTVFIDAGTNTYEMLPFINQKKLTIVTNSITLISSLVKDGHQVYLLGGKVKAATNAIIGSEAAKKLDSLSFDKCFIGTNGIDPAHGYSTPDNDEAMIKSTALAQSKAKYILGDASKFCKTAFVKFAELDDAVLITNDIQSDFIQNIFKLTTVIGGM